MSTNKVNTAQMRNEQISTEIMKTIESANSSKNKPNKNTNHPENTSKKTDNSEQFPLLNQNSNDIQPGTSSSSIINPSNNPKQDYRAAVTNLSPNFTRVQKLIRMKIIPPFTRAHLQTPENFEKATNECYVAILRSFSPRLRPMITIAKTHTIIGNRKLQTLMVTAPIEAEEEVANMQLSGLQILDRTILPTADEIWRYSPSMYPKKFTLRIEGLPILCGDEELLEVIQMPCGDILSEINRHTVTTEIGVVYTGTAHATLQVKSEQEENILKDWSRANGISDKTNWHGITIRAHVPRLHSCSICSTHTGREIFGHDEAWCRKRRPVTSRPVEPIEERIAADGNDEQIDENAPPNDNNVEREDGEIEPDGVETEQEDSSWYQQTRNHRKREKAQVLTPSSTPAKNKFQAFADETSISPQTSPRNRSPNPQKQLFNG